MLINKRYINKAIQIALTMLTASQLAVNQLAFADAPANVLPSTDEKSPSFIGQYADVRPALIYSAQLSNESLQWLRKLPAQSSGDANAQSLASPHNANTAIADTDPRLLQAEALFAQQDFVALKPLLASLKQEAPPHLAVLFLSGMLASQEGDYAKAADAFRAMLTRDPSLIRPRLELALALQKSGDRQAAKYHYEQALAANLPDSVKRNVYQQLGDIRERLPSVRLSVDVVTDSNPKQTTSSHVINIGGLPYILNDTGSAKSVTGLLVTADASLPLPSNPSWYAHAYGEAYEYPGRELDLLYGDASVGKRFDFGQHSVSLETGVHGSIYQHKTLYAGILTRSSVFMRPLPKLALLLDASFKTYDYTSLPYLSGNMISIGITNIYVPSPSQRWDFSANMAKYSADEAAYSYTQPGLSARFVQEWPGGWITGLRLQGLVADYAAPDPFFGETRHDKEGRVEIDLLNRKLKLWAFSPKLLMGYVKRSSNLDLYSYDRAYLRVGLSTEF